LPPPGESVKMRILESDAEGRPLAATFCGRRHDLTTGELVAALLRLPLVTLKVMGAIHFEALRLWLKCARIHSPPRPHAAQRKDAPGGAPPPLSSRSPPGRRAVPGVTPPPPPAGPAAPRGLRESAGLAFRFAARLQRGTLDAVMPDGRRFRFGGIE